MSVIIEAKDIREVLLGDGWHRVQPGTFRYADAAIRSEGKQTLPVESVVFTEPDGYTVVCLRGSILGWRTVDEAPSG
jgi:hypothetical protein